MANTYGAHWRILFTSLRTGTHYNLDVYSKNYSGSVVYLKGADQPFVTEEQDDEDVFTPVRTQTGYLRILDDGFDEAGNAFNWRDLMPADALDRPVKLWHTENNQTIIDWLGYLQPQNFSSDYAPGVQKREFPVCNELAALQNKYIPPINTDQILFNFAYFIRYFTDILMPADRKYYLCGGNEAASWIVKEISWGQFSEKDADNNIVSKYKYFDILEEICKLFGWTCRQVGANFYFDSSTDPDFSKWLILDSRDLDDAADGHDDVGTEANKIILQNLPTDFVSTNNKIANIRGWNKSTVEAKINTLSAVLEYPNEDVEKYYWAYSIRRREAGRGLYHFYKPEDPALDHESQQYTGQVHIDATDVELDYMTGRIKYQTKGGYEVVDGVGEVNLFDYAQEENPHNVDLGSYLDIYHGSDGEKPVFKMTSKKMFSFSNGKFVLSGKTSRTHINTSQVPNSYEPHSGMGTLVMSLKIGNKYFDGSNWTYTKSTFPIVTGGGQINGEGEFPNSKIWNDGYPKYDGTGIPVNSILFGRIEICIWEFYDREAYNEATGYDPYRAAPIHIKDLKLEFIRPNSAKMPNDKTENKYIVESASPFSEDKTIELLFFTDNNNQYAENVIFNEDGTYCQQMTIGGVAQHPEQHLVNRMAAWGAQTHDVLSFETTPNDGAGTITPMHVVQSGGKTYSSISISRDWRDDVMKIKYIEMLPTT